MYSIFSNISPKRESQQKEKESTKGFAFFDRAIQNRLIVSLKSPIWETVTDNYYNIHLIERIHSCNGSRTHLLIVYYIR